MSKIALAPTSSGPKVKVISDDDFQSFVDAKDFTGSDGVQYSSIISRKYNDAFVHVISATIDGDQKAPKTTGQAPAKTSRKVS